MRPLGAARVGVDSAETASQEIETLLEKNNITVSGINRLPFTLEDVFISLIEEYEGQSVSPVGLENEKGT